MQKDIEANRPLLLPQDKTARGTRDRFERAVRAGLGEVVRYDEYFKDAYSFSVFEYDITVSDVDLAEALTALPADRRDIVLLSYFLDMTDKEIAERLNLVRRTVAYRRTCTLQELKNLMEGYADE